LPPTWSSDKREGDQDNHEGRTAVLVIFPSAVHVYISRIHIYTSTTNRITVRTWSYFFIGTSRVRTSGASSASERPTPATRPCVRLSRAASACAPSPVPLLVSFDLTVHACGGKLSCPLPSGATTMDYAWPCTPATRKLLLAHDAVADRPHPAGIRRERKSIRAWMQLHAPCLLPC
jgi:hypothetical protein